MTEMILELKEREKAAPLFQGWQDTMIWSCLQGVMGKIYADSSKEPVSAMAVLGDFCFFAGKPDREFVLCGQAQGERGFRIFVPENAAWASMIEGSFGERAEKVVRYAFKKEPDVFDRGKLQGMVNGLPEGYALKMMDEDLFRRCGKIEWCRDWVAQYGDYAMYQRYGLGVVICEDKEPVSGASSYSGYNGGIEIEIDTRKDHRRRGLAGICGAKLILECLERGLYPSWDAQNKWSAALAEKLGYHLECEYTAYEVTGERQGGFLREDSL